MKKFCLILLCLLLAAMPVLSADRIEVVVSGEVLSSDADAEILNGRTFVPLRAIAEELGAEVEWKQESQGIRLTKDQRRTDLAIGSLSASVEENGSVRGVTLEDAPYIKDERTYVPLRFIAQGLGSRTVWCEELRTAVIIDNYGRTYPIAAELLEYFLGTTLPNAITADNAKLAEALLDDPQSIIDYFSNLWEEHAAEVLVNDVMDDDDMDAYSRLPADNEIRFDFLSELAEENGFSLRCPVKMCIVKNNGTTGIIMDAPAARTATLVTQYALLNQDGALVALPL